jgi:hypothetical protein
MRLPGSIVPAYGAPFTGALFCFPGQDLKGAAYKKNMTSPPSMYFLLAQKNIFHNEPLLFSKPEASQTTSLFARI